MSEEQVNEVEETEVEVSNDLEVEIIDDTPEQDRGRPRRAEGQEPDVPDDEEIQNYSDNVQSRIKKLKFEFHEERRRKEESERIRDEAVKYAQKLYEENKKLQDNLSKGETALVHQAKGRVEAELEKAKAAYKQAYETGDTDGIVASQERLATLAAEKQRFERYKPRKQQPQQEFTPPQQQAPQAVEPDPEAKEWAERNPWFGKDKAMTGFAYGLHEELVGSGVDPRTSDYYQKIDERMREAFPAKFGAQQRQQGSVVAPATRSSKSPRKITLTQSQVALAKRLGLSPEQYAAQMLKEMS